MTRLPLLAGVILCFCHFTVCASSDASPATWSYTDVSGVVCTLLDYEGVIFIKYPKTDGSFGQFVTPLTPTESNTNVTGSCGEDPWIHIHGNLYDLELHFAKESTTKHYKMKEMKIEITKKLFTDAHVSTPNQFIYTDVMLKTELNKSYSCGYTQHNATNDNVTATLDIQKIRIEAFRSKKDKIFSEAEMCTRPAIGCNRSVQVEFSANIHTKVNTTSGVRNVNITVSTNDTMKTIACSNSTQNLTLTWGSWGTLPYYRLLLSFSKNSNKYYLALVDVTIATDFAGTINLNHKGEELKTALSHSYLSHKGFTFPLVSNFGTISEAKITFSNYHGEAFRSGNGTEFSENDGESITGSRSGHNKALILEGFIGGLIALGAAAYLIKAACTK